MAGAAPSYAFVRREMPNYQQLGQAGYTPLFEYDDPRLAQQVAAAQAAGSQYGIWGAPTGNDPAAFAQQLAGLNQQYHPSVIVPDIEFVGKGYAGSPGYQYNQDFANALKQDMPGANIALTMMGNQNDFNYGAYKGIVSQYLPQAYGADPTKETYDPGAIVQTLINNGVDPSQIAPILAGSQMAGYQGPSALYTYDDNMLNLPHASQGSAPAPSAAPSAARAPQSSAPAPRTPDAQNPRAVAYANMRLHQLVRAGVLKSMPQGDPTAAWRQQSQSVSQLAQQAGYANARDFLKYGNVRPKSAPAAGRAQ